MESEFSSQHKADYAAILDRQVGDLLSDLLMQKGYEYKGILMKNDDLLGEFVETVFENPTTGRIVRLGYLPPVPRGVDVLSIHIEDGPRGTFSATEYLKYVGAPPELADKLRLKNYNGSLEERIHDCLAAFVSIKDQYFDHILDGKEWVHVPIDWQDHK